jgi:hypothetical protein
MHSTQRKSAKRIVKFKRHLSLDLSYLRNHFLPSFVGWVRIAHFKFSSDLGLLDREVNTSR